MKRTGLLLSVVALACLLPGRLSYGDHAKSRRAHDKAASESVKARLVELGCSDREAADRVAALTSGELSYYAADRSRVQVVAGLWGEEWALGVGFLTVLGIIAAIIISDAKK